MDFIIVQQEQKLGIYFLSAARLGRITFAESSLAVILSRNGGGHHPCFEGTEGRVSEVARLQRLSSQPRARAFPRRILRRKFVEWFLSFHDP